MGDKGKKIAVFILDIIAFVIVITGMTVTAIACGTKSWIVTEVKVTEPITSVGLSAGSVALQSVAGPFSAKRTLYPDTAYETSTTIWYNDYTSAPDVLLPDGTWFYPSDAAYWGRKIFSLNIVALSFMLPATIAAGWLLVKCSKNASVQLFIWSMMAWIFQLAGLVILYNDGPELAAAAARFYFYSEIYPTYPVPSEVYQKPGGSGALSTFSFVGYAFVWLILSIPIMCVACTVSKKSSKQGKGDRDVEKNDNPHPVVVAEPSPVPMYPPQAQPTAV
mmetsp:Transcript_26327/g.45276  ORF Transcript_26327/g.45276 Transcript_26327/m.45276 type:complete len:277 (-) Transcript_26327:246-1076(-)